MNARSHRFGIWPLFLVLLAGGGCKWLPHAGKAAASVPPPRMLKLNSTVVNLADAGGSAYLRVGITLALSGPAGDDTQVQSVAADTVLTLAGADTSAQLLAAGGKQELKHALLSRLQQRLPQAGVQAIYYDDFLVQP